MVRTPAPDDPRLALPDLIVDATVQQLRFARLRLDAHDASAARLHVVTALALLDEGAATARLTRATTTRVTSNATWRVRTRALIACGIGLGLVGVGALFHALGWDWDDVRLALATLGGLLVLFAIAAVVHALVLWIRDDPTPAPKEPPHA